MQSRKMSIADYVLASFFAGTIVVVAAGVVWRYVLRSPLVWTVELSRILFVWMTFLGAALAVKEGSHICVTLLVEHLPGRVRKYLGILRLILVVAFLGFMVYVGARWVQLTAGTRTPALGLPLNYVSYAALPVGFLLAIYFDLRQVVAAFRNGSSKSASKEGT